MTKAIYINDKLPGTRELVQEVLRTSSVTEGLGPAWRIVRAALIKAISVEFAPADHCWMETSEFTAWLERHRFAIGQHGSINLMPLAVGIGKDRRADLVAGAAITKIEALACAHYAMDFQPPVAVGDAAGFSTFVFNNFGRPVDLAKALNIRADYVTDRMKGFRVTTRNPEIPCLPPIDMIRAADWVRRIGPSSPYGREPPRPQFLNLERF